ANFPMQVFNRQIANGVAASVKQNAVEIQIEVRACRGEIDVKCGRWGSRDMKAANHYWTKKWGIDLINAHREPFLSAFPPDPQSALNIGARNAVPQAVFKCQNVHLVLLNAENLGVRKLDEDFCRANIDCDMLP